VIRERSAPLEAIMAAETGKLIRVVCLSDTHDRQADIKVPDGDILIHCGDLTMAGDQACAREGIAWLASLPHRRKLFVPGNHDLCFEAGGAFIRELSEEFPSVETLIDRDADAFGLRVYGSPWTPGPARFAFAYNPHQPRVPSERWALIPDDTQILITHTPPQGIHDLTASGKRLGCSALRTRLQGLRALQLHAFGHVHEAQGTIMLRRVQYVNAAICDERYRPNQAPVVVDLPRALPSKVDEDNA
jgi:calcineurin-like phosphoesterase family protein